MNKKRKFGQLLEKENLHPRASLQTSPSLHRFADLSDYEKPPSKIIKPTLQDPPEQTHKLRELKSTPGKLHVHQGVSQPPLETITEELKPSEPREPCELRDALEAQGGRKAQEALRAPGSQINCIIHLDNFCLINNLLRNHPIYQCQINKHTDQFLC